jgi:hypothetical protein
MNDELIMLRHVGGTFGGMLFEDDLANPESNDVWFAIGNTAVSPELIVFRTEERHGTRVIVEQIFDQETTDAIVNTVMQKLAEMAPDG